MLEGSIERAFWYSSTARSQCCRASTRSASRNARDATQPPVRRRAARIAALVRCVVVILTSASGFLGHREPARDVFGEADEREVDRLLVHLPHDEASVEDIALARVDEPSIVLEGGDRPVERPEEPHQLVRNR